MTRLILSLAITAALAATACTGQVRAGKAAAPAQDATALQASTDAPAGGLDLGMIDAGIPSGDVLVPCAYIAIDACITQ